MTQPMSAKCTAEVAQAIRAMHKVQPVFMEALNPEEREELARAALTARQHDFDGAFGACRGCGKYVEDLIDEPLCSSDISLSPHQLVEQRAELVEAIVPLLSAIPTSQDHEASGDPETAVVMVSDLLRAAQAYHRATASQGGTP